MKKYIVTFCLILFIFLSVGCSNVEIIKKDDTSQIISPFTGDYESEIIIYYPMVEQSKLGKESRLIDSQNKSYEEVVLDEILKGPINREFRQIMPSNLKILSVDVIGQIAYLNFNSELINSNYAESEEILMIYSIVNTMTQIDKITSVQFLVDGDRASFKNNSLQITEPLDSSKFLSNIEFVSPINFIENYYNRLVENKELSENYYNPNKEIHNSLENLDIEAFKIMEVRYNKYSTSLAVNIKIEYQKNGNKAYLLQKIDLSYDQRYKIENIEDFE